MIFFRYGIYERFLVNRFTSFLFDVIEYASSNFDYCDTSFLYHDS